MFAVDIIVVASSVVVMFAAMVVVQYFFAFDQPFDDVGYIPKDDRIVTSWLRGDVGGPWNCLAEGKNASPIDIYHVVLAHIICINDA